MNNLRNLIGRCATGMGLLALSLDMGLVSAFAQDWSKIRRVAEDSIVFIEASKARPDGSDIEERFGTGFVISGSGHIITAAHLIPDDAKGWLREIYVTRRTIDRHRVPAQLVKRDSDLDLAVLMVSASKTWRPLCFGDSSKVAIEAQLYKLGYGGGTELASDANRLTNKFGPRGQWQTNLALNPGDSGAPVFDIVGRVVGIASAGYEDRQLITFVIPASHSNSLRDTVGAGSPQECAVAPRHAPVEERNVGLGAWEGVRIQVDYSDQVDALHAGRTVRRMLGALGGQVQAPGTPADIVIDVHALVSDRDEIGKVVAEATLTLVCRVATPRAPCFSRPFVGRGLGEGPNRSVAKERAVTAAVDELRVQLVGMTVQAR